MAGARQTFFAQCEKRPHKANGGPTCSEPSSLTMTRHQNRHDQSNPCQGPNVEAHHADNGRNRHPPPWRPAALHTRHTATLTTGITAPNLVLSGLFRRPTSNTAIPTTRTTTPLCQGPHRSCPRHQTSETPPSSHRDVMPPKMPPRLRVTDHHGVDQPSATTEDAIHAIEPPTPEIGRNGDHPRHGATDPRRRGETVTIPCPDAPPFERTTRSGR
jgi:hypothetical protein